MTVPLSSSIGENEQFSNRFAVFGCIRFIKSVEIQREGCEFAEAPSGERIASGLNTGRSHRNCHHVAPFTEPSNILYTCVVCTRTRNRQSGVHVPRTRTGTCTLHRIETPTSLLTLTHEWERGTLVARKKEASTRPRVYM